MHVAREYVGNNADPVDGDCITGKTIGTIHERAGILEEVLTDHRTSGSLIRTANIVSPALPPKQQNWDCPL